MKAGVNMRDDCATKLTPNEAAWIEYLRLESRDTDPQLTLAGVHAIRAVLRRQPERSNAFGSSLGGHLRAA